MVVRKRLSLHGPAMVFVTTTVLDWLPVFSSSRCANALLQQLLETVEFHRLSVAAYVLMPSHLHALIGFPEIEKLSSVMRNVKSLSARRIQPLLPPELRRRLRAGGKYRLWRPRFDDLIIWSETQFRIKAEYIHNNPVKAGLTETATDYPYSSARDCLTDDHGVIPIDAQWSWQRGDG